MAHDAQLNQIQQTYRSAVESWIAAIRNEESLASGSQSIAEVDRWERAHADEELARNEAMTAKKEYEAALRKKFFGFS